MSSKVTSLSAQLKRLQVPQTSILSKLGETRRSSFLFDPKEAANMDSESVYCLAMNGLEQLKAIDREAFGSFEATLFAQSSITYERLVQTKDVNAQLDVELRRFLLHLTPYFMLKPAHKCFEWLVYKYKVHVYNVDDVFMCVLPYHDTNYFVRALQLIDFSDEFNNAATWSWLLDNQKRGVRLASTTLATHLFSDLTLFNFVKSCLQANLNEFAPDEDEANENENEDEIGGGDEQVRETRRSSQTISAHKSTCLNFLFSYLSKLLLESIKQLSIVSATTSKKNVNNKQQEAFFALLLPLLFSGLKSDLIQYKQLAHLVLAFLFEKFVFNSKTVNRALFSVCKGVSYFRDVPASSLDTESIECIKSSIVTMCLLVQSQLDHQVDEMDNNNNQSVVFMKKNFFDKFIKNLTSPRHIEPILMSTLDELNQSYRIEKFLKCMLMRLLDEAVAYDTSDLVDTNEKSKKKSLTIDLDRHEEDEHELTSNETNVYFRLLVKLLDLFNLNKSPKLVECLCMHAFRTLVRQLELNKLPNLYVEYHLCDVVFRLECKYPVLFDKCLNLYLDASNQELSKRGKTYFLNTISFKFNSFKCRHTFKYQQIDAAAVNNQELNLIQSLASPNESIRANAVKFLYTSLSSSKQQFKLDSDFIRAEIDNKLRHESSPTVLSQLIQFGIKLLDYFPLNELLVDERLLALFDSSRSRMSSDSEWTECRLAALDLVFNEIYLKNSDRKDEFFDAFLRVVAAIFSSTSSQDGRLLTLIERLKKTAFYSHLIAESHSTNGTELTNQSPIKKFYSSTKTTTTTNGSSSITITTNNGHCHANNNGTSITSSDTENEQNSNETNEQFEQLLQTGVKYMMVRGRKANTITAPSGFEKCRRSQSHNRPISLYDLTVYELCVRLCAQSLFFTNADYYFNLAIHILVNLVGDKSVFNLKIKKSSNKIDDTISTSNRVQHHNTLSSYKQIVDKQTIKNLNLLISSFTHLFKSLSIQTSNFVNPAMRGEIEKSLNRLYVYLCELATSKHTSVANAGASILNKFVESACFSSAHTPVTGSPTKITTSQPLNYSYFQFSFKFLINYNDEEASQLETIRLYEANLGQLLETNKRTDSWLLSSVVLALAWSLTSKTSEVRLSTLALVRKLYETMNSHTELDEDVVVWKDFIKKLLKYKEEIEMDGGDYIRTKLNKILSSDEKLSTKVIEQLSRFIALSLKSSSRQHAALSPKVAQFDASSTPDLDIKCLVLIRFKHIVLELFALVNDDTKLKLMESIFSMLVANLNESSALVLIDDDHHLRRVNKAILSRLVDSYLLNDKAYVFFNKNEKYFDYLIGYLNNNCSDKSAELLRYFKQEFMSKLASTQPESFWSRLQARMQIDLLKCTFDIWLCNSSRALESTLVTSESIQENIDYLGAIRRVLISSYRLTAQHYVCLLVERANMDAIAVVANETPGTTKEMRKQLKKVNGEKRIDWRAVRLLLDLLESKLANMENRMETDETEKQEVAAAYDPIDLIDLVPYLFQLLDCLESKYLTEVHKSTSSGGGGNGVEEQQQITSTECLLLESLCLNSLMIVYRVNKHLASSSGVSKSRLESAKFNIELLMQILQTKPCGEDEESGVSGEGGEERESTVDRLKVQQNVLILLSEIASVFPDKVLEHVLIMFVFVGNKLTRKDDSYSFHVINQIIKSILPAIVASCIEEQQHSSKSEESQKSRLASTVNTMQRHQKQLPYVSSLVCKILQSFVVALPHIPAHRKAIIFQNLMSIIGLNDYLWITVIQALDHYLVQSQDLLEFKSNLEEFTNKQKELLANGATMQASIAGAAAASHDGSMSVDMAAAKEKKLRSTLMQCMEAMMALHVQFQPSDVIQSTIYLTTFLNKYLSKLFHSSKTSSKSTAIAKPKQLVYSHLACQLDYYNLQQMKYLSYSMLTFVNEILNSPELITKLADAQSSSLSSSQLFETLLERILLLILNLSSAEESSSSSSPDMIKFQKTLLNKSLDLLERTIQLLDSRQFIDAVKRLLKHELLQLRRRALGLLNTKLRRYEPSESEVSLLISLVDDLLDSIQLDCANAEVEINNQTVLFSLKLLCKRIGEHNPLAFVKVIKYLNENLLEKSLYWKETNAMRLENANLLSSVLLCCGELCLKLKSNALVYLNQIVRFDLDAIDFVRGKLESAIQLKKTDEEELIDSFEENRASSKKSDNEQSKFLKKFKTYELLILSCVTCLQKIVQNMANFMSPFLGRLIYVCCSLSYLTAANQQKKAAAAVIVEDGDVTMTEVTGSKPFIQSPTASSVSQLDAKLTLLRSTIATQIPLRLLAPILSQQSIGLTDDDNTMNGDGNMNDDTYKMRLKYVEFYMQIARLAIKQSNQEDLLANIKAIRAMFMNLFDLRTNVNARLRSAVKSKKTMSKRMDAYLANELGRYENYVIGAFCEFTFKLSEDLFRPIFFKLFEWSSVNNAPTDRLITFYRCTFKLSDKLKNLFVIFASQFVQNAADLLNQLNSSKTDKKFFESSKTHAKEHLLLVNIVDTLSNVFMNDTQRTFVNKDRFNVLMEPLVDQIENESDSGEENDDSTSTSTYRDFISQHLAPCIGNFASCCLNDDALVRKFNYQILLKTKSSSVQVRLATMDVLNVFSKKIGDIYNSYLPETVPFLAELMEDPVEEVEEKVQNVIKDLEDVLGESLQSYFV